MLRAWGIVVDAPGPHGGLQAPRKGIDLEIDVNGDVVAAAWESEDEGKQPDGKPHRWRYWVPRERIGVLIYDLGSVEEDDADS